MNEKELLRDIYDVLMGNSEYITREQFLEKYKDYDFVCDHPYLRIMHEKGEWTLTLSQIYSSVP